MTSKENSVKKKNKKTAQSS